MDTQQRRPVHRLSVKTKFIAITLTSPNAALVSAVVGGVLLLVWLIRG